MTYIKKLFAIFLITIFLFPIGVFAAECPKGLTNDPYPGNCGLYTDKNVNSVCDLSEESPSVAESNTLESADLKDLITGKEIKTKTVQEIADLYLISAPKFATELTKLVGKEISIGDNFQLLHDNYGLSPDFAKDVAVAMRLGTPSTNMNVKETGNEYYMLELTVLFSLLYAVSLFLVKRGKLSVITNRKIWNALLTISFLITILTSVFVLLRLNYGIIISFPLNLVYWHIEIGYVMILISILHTFWHIPYLKSYFNK